MIRLTEQEDLRLSFSVVAIEVAQTTTTSSTVRISVPSPDEEDQSPYLYHLAVSLRLGISPAAPIGTRADIRDLTVASAPTSPQQLSEPECELLARAYNTLLLSTGDTSDESPFTVDEAPPPPREEPAAAAAVAPAVSITSSGALLALVVQLITDSADASLQETLANTASHHQSSALAAASGGGAGGGAGGGRPAAANAAAPSGDKRTRIVDVEAGGGAAAVAAVSANNGAGNNAFRQRCRDERQFGGQQQRHALCRIRIAKIDHMNDERMYLNAIRDSAEVLVFGDPAAGDFQFGAPGLLGVAIVKDPVSLERRIVGSICVVEGESRNEQQQQVNSETAETNRWAQQQQDDGPGGGDSSASATSSSATPTPSPMTSPFTATATTTTTTTTNASSSAVDAGHVLLKDLRTSYVDVDSHGRKARERQMRTLGFGDVTVSYEHWCRHVAPLFTAERGRVQRIAPESRETARQVLKQIFVQPFSGAGQGAQQWMATAAEIFDDATLFSHV